jgi:uncharacterized alkaline shock family protein YloU
MAGSSPGGQVDIAIPAIAGIVVAALRPLPDLIGLALAKVYTGAVPALPWTQARRGVTVQASARGLQITVNAILTYGVAVNTVVAHAEQTVRQALQHALGRDDLHIQILVQGLRTAPPARS